MSGTLGQIERWSAESAAESTTTSNTFQQKVRLTTPSLPSGQYLLFYQWELENQTAEEAAEAQIEQDDATQIAATMYINVDLINDDKQLYGGFAELTLSGVTTFDIDYRDVDAGTAAIQRARIELVRLYS